MGELLTLDQMNTAAPPQGARQHRRTLVHNVHLSNRLLYKPISAVERVNDGFQKRLETPRPRKVSESDLATSVGSTSSPSTRSCPDCANWFLRQSGTPRKSYRATWASTSPCVAFSQANGWLLSTARWSGMDL